MKPNKCLILGGAVSYTADHEIVNQRKIVSLFKFFRFHGSIIGRGGATLRKIREETGTEIDIPPKNSDGEIITITGHKKDAEKARDMILAIQTEMVSRQFINYCMLVFPRTKIQ